MNHQAGGRIHEISPTLLPLPLLQQKAYLHVDLIPVNAKHIIPAGSPAVTQEEMQSTQADPQRHSRTPACRNR